MHKIKEKLMEELYEYEDKLKKSSGGKLSAGDLETLHKLTDTIKNIDKIEMLEEDGYSEDGGNWVARGNYGGMHDGMHSYNEGGSSYARGRRNAKRDSMGRYSRDGGYGEDGGSSYARGGNRGGYSRDDGKHHMIEKLEDMMDEAGSEKERRAIKECISTLENA